MIQRFSLRSFGGWLALAAVAMQLVLSYGHIHSVLPGRGHSGGIVQLLQPDQGSNPSPASDAADKACEICAVMALAGTLVLPEPSALPEPAFAGLVTATPERATALSTAQYVLYRTRAPPTV